MPSRAAKRALLPRRLAAQLLTGPRAADATTVVERLLAVQAQDARAARLAIRSRTEGLGASDVDRALTDDRSLVISWLNRGTLHLVRSEDYQWLNALMAGKMAAWNKRRLAQEGVTADAADRGVTVVERALSGEGPLDRDQLRDRLRSAGVAADGAALAHLLYEATLRLGIVRGPVAGARQAFVLVRDWLGRQPEVDRDAALAELARRFLAGHGPADAADLARWAGLGVRDARAGLSAIGAELEDRGDGLVDLAGRPAADELPPPRLLGGFDPVLFGWVDREPILRGRADVVTMNGIFKPIALVEGRAVGTWTMPRGRVELAPFGRLSRRDRSALDDDAADVARFLAS